MTNRFPYPFLQDKHERIYSDEVATGVHPANASVQAYISFYYLSWSEVARAAGLLLIVLWRVTRALPVSPGHAAALRSGLFRLTGIAYTGPIVTFPQGQHPPGVPWPAFSDQR